MAKDNGLFVPAKDTHDNSQAGSVLLHKSRRGKRHRAAAAAGSAYGLEGRTGLALQLLDLERFPQFRP